MSEFSWRDIIELSQAHRIPPWELMKLTPEEIRKGVPMNNIKQIYDNEKDMQPKPQSNGLGTAIGLLLCGVLIMAFPRFMQMDAIGLWAFSIIGFVAILWGILGGCTEIGKKS
jgi:hypothetical protein